MPTRPKLLPQPCPQCENRYGGCQLILFNPKYYYIRTGYERRTPYVILRIYHGYSKTEKTKNNTRKKIVHHFRTRTPWSMIVGSGANERKVSTNELFNQSGYSEIQSICFKLDPELIQQIRTEGWKHLNIETDGAHWLKKAGDLKICPRCHTATKRLQEYQHPRLSYKLFICDACIKAWQQD